MSQVFPYTLVNDLAQLHDELLRASISPELVEASIESPDDVTITVPDDVVEADVDAVIAAHVPKTRYDSATKLAEVAATRERARLRADYERLAVLFRAVGVEASGVNPDLADVLEAATVALIDVLKRRDRAAGVYY